MNFAQVAKALTEGLNLAKPPIGLAFVDEPPAGVPRYNRPVPSACSFWKSAETALFYATADDHYNCPIGAITQGFPIPNEIMQQGMALVERMGIIRYFDPAEAAHVPAVGKAHRVIVYGPLGMFGEIAPDVALVTCTPYQAMLLAEATGASSWRGAGSETRVFGRPACAVIPKAVNDSATAVSVGCMGARTFAGIGEGEMIVAVPLSGVDALSQRSQNILRANSEMRNYYNERKSQYAAV